VGPGEPVHVGHGHGHGHGHAIDYVVSTAPLHPLLISYKSLWPHFTTDYQS
jgi:hypothetical protein